MAVDTLKIIKVLNNDAELKSMALRPIIKILTDRDLSSIKSADIYLVNLGSSDGIGPLSYTFSEKDIDNYGIEEVQYSFNDSEMWVYPKNTLLPESRYTLLIPSGSKFNKVDIHDSINTYTGVSCLSIKILSEPQSVDSYKRFAAEISLDGLVVTPISLIDTSQNIEVGGGILKLKDDFDYEKGMIIEVSTNTEYIVYEDYSVNFSTATPVSMGEDRTIEPSTTIKRDDVVKFFNNTSSWGSGSGSGATSTPNGSPTISEDAKYKTSIIQPNIVRFEFLEPIDISSVIDSNISIDFSEAFGNTMLSKIGHYNRDNRYYVDIFFKRGNTIMEFKISKNDDDTGPKYTIRRAGE